MLLYNLFLKVSTMPSLQCRIIVKVFRGRLTRAKSVVDNMSYQSLTCTEHATLKPCLWVTNLRFLVSFDRLQMIVSSTRFTKLPIHFVIAELELAGNIMPMSFALLKPRTHRFANGTLFHGGPFFVASHATMHTARGEGLHMHTIQSTLRTSTR